VVEVGGEVERDDGRLLEIGLEEIVLRKVFQENNLGSLQPGKLADLIVIDRDYLTVPRTRLRTSSPR